MKERFKNKTQPLVVFYSRTGNTKKVGELIAQKLNCNTEDIIDNKNRKGSTGAIVAIIRPNAPTTIQNMSDPQDNLVIIGTPIWWYTHTPAVKTYLEEYKPKRVAFYFTCAVDNKITAFGDMENICGVKPVATLRIDKKDMEDLENSKKINEFVKLLCE